MKKSKKGFTLIELIIGLLVLGIAIISGTQLFTAAGHGHSNSAKLAAATESLSSAFDTGAAGAAVPPDTTYSEVPATVKIKLPSGKTYVESSIMVDLLYGSGSVHTQLFGLKGSYGDGN